MSEITMPRLSDTMIEGVIARWQKKPGDVVKRGDVLCEIETDKATMELEAYDAGTLQAILIEEGKTVPIGTPIAIIDDGKDAGKEQHSPASPPPPPSSASKPAEEIHSGAPETGNRMKASPLARTIASRYGIDLRQVTGSGPDGRIIGENVEQFHEQQSSTTPAVSPASSSEVNPETIRIFPLPVDALLPITTPEPDAVPLSRMRVAIASRMSESKHGTPHVYMTSEIAMEATLALREQINQGGASPVKISVNDMVIKAIAQTLRTYPIFNSSYVVGEGGKPALLEHPHINIAVAVAVEDGLIVPVVAQADTKSLSTIAAEVRDLALRAREGHIKQSELENATFTISNLGMFDVLEFAAIITPPQSAVLAVSSIRQIPVVRNGEITIGSVMNVTLSSDHRVTDGATAARFLQHLKDLLQSPLKLLV